ncbi:MAG: alpha/beta fold hydrolase [Anaerolineales bacterium]|jgi:long-chain acyl-CoA synthetase
MEIDLELYRREVRVSNQPVKRLSVIDISPEQAQGTMIFVHGYGGQALQWQYQLNHFSRANRIVAPDLPGHGQSDRSAANYRMPVILEDFKQALNQLQVQEPFVMVGHSFGGAIATEFAAAYPQRVSHLILIATAGEFKLNLLYRLLLKLPYTTLRLLDPFTRGWLNAPPNVLKAWYDENLSKWNGWSMFRSLTVPTLVIRGHSDIVFERPMFEEVARAIPLSEEIDVGASGHMVMLERREAVNRAITRFLEAPDGSWRQPDVSADDKERAALIEERRWLPYYDEGVPYTVAVPNIPVQELLLSAARRFPGRAALYFGGRRISYRRLNQETNRFANALRSLGVEKGDRVLLFMPNTPQLVISFFGALKAGAVAVFTQPTTEPKELIHYIRESGARVLVTLTQFDELFYHIQNELEPDGSSPLQHIIFTHIADYLPAFKRVGFLLSRERRRRHLLDIPLDASMHIFKRLSKTHSKSEPEIECLPEDLAVIQYTGGTTSAPKGVMLSHRNLVSNAFQTRHWIPDAQEGRERFLCALPFSHSYGMTAALIVPIAIGALLLLQAKFEVTQVLKTIQKLHPTIFPGVPSMYVAIKDYPGVRKYGIRSMRACISGSAPLPVEVQEAFEKLTRGHLVEGYGLTEASPITHANPLNGTRKVGSIGIPLPSTQARIVHLKRSNEEVPPGQIGELAVRGPQVMLGYWQDARATRRVLKRDGWLLTGDVAQMDTDGYFRIVARKADMWYPSKPGEPAFPRDVEEVLFEIPQIQDAAVVAVAGQPVAFVITRKEHPGAEAIIAYCKRRLPPELVPRLVIFVDDFPRTFIGKVLRRELTRRFKLNLDQPTEDN